MNHFGNPILRRWSVAALLLAAVLVQTFFADTGRAQTALPPGTIKSAAGFYHPGILVNRAQLDFIKGKVAAAVEPWKSAFEAAKASPMGAVAYIPHPWKTCECGSYSNPDHGCKDEQRDTAAAYTQALL